MKKILMILQVVGAVFVFLFAAISAIIGVTDGETVMAVFGFLFCAAAVAVVVRVGVKNAKAGAVVEWNPGETQPAQQADPAEKSGAGKKPKVKIRKYKFTHVMGLPVMEGAVCKVLSKPDKITIRTQGTVWVLPKEKIKYIGQEENVKIYAQAVSSIGGALVGGMMFGTVGAAVGGMAKQRNFQSKRLYLVIAYTGDDDSVKYIVFDYISKAQKFIKDFYKNTPPKRIVQTL